MLYVGMGDGGSANDPHGHGQNAGTLLGSLLRLDVDGGDPYRVPADNPFVGVPGAAPEVWAIGLRNPWRFSFDEREQLIYVADVGQGRREEINVQPAGTAGANYGWNRMEGSLCFSPSTGCDQSGLVLPVEEYGRDVGCSVTGGYVYRGAQIPEIAGHYFYADYCTGAVRSFRRAPDGQIVDRRAWSLGDLGNVSSFGRGGNGELYIVSHQGRIYRLEG